MTNKTAFSILQNYRFVESKKAQLIKTLNQVKFSGKLAWIAPNNSKTWLFYFRLGHIMYATGGTHPVRRWARNVAAYCPQIQVNYTRLQRDLRHLDPHDSTTSWDYQLFSLWLEQQKITQQQVEQAIQSIVSETLFDLSQHEGLTHQIQEYHPKIGQIVFINEQQAIAEVQQLWQTLWNAKITIYSLERAPIIKQPQQLKNRTPDKVYYALTKLLNGENTLQDLAVKMKRDVVQVIRLLLPYIKSGLVELATIPDLPTPISPSVSEPSSKPNHFAQPFSKPLIACVDDSPAICQTLEKLLTAAGYQYLGINDALRAITILLTRKPDLIFLDLLMPNTNGYEICGQLRKAPSFRTTPIVILTGNDGVVDQVRARLVGASDFLSKPVDSRKVLSTISKHLSQEAVNARRVQR